jgi:deoxycytidine triphosphate deaminase
MSIINLLNRVTQDKLVFDKSKTSDKSLIFTNASTIEDFTLELKLGEYWSERLVAGRTEMYKIEGNSVQIRPKSCVVIETEEEINIPNNLYGIILAKGDKILSKGVFCATSKIKPGHYGHLQILLFNSSDSKVEIEKGTIIASTIFFRTEITPEFIQPTTRANQYVEKEKGFLKNFVKSLKDNHRNNPYDFWFKIITLILTIFASASGALFIRTYFLKQP